MPPFKADDEDGFVSLPRGEFAQRVFGKKLNPLQAGHALPAMIRDLVVLHRDLTAAGYVPNKRYYTARQLKILSEYINRHPGVVNEYVRKFQFFSKRKEQ